MKAAGRATPIPHYNEATDESLSVSFIPISAYSPSYLEPYEAHNLLSSVRQHLPKYSPSRQNE
jgi:hypothetical protein